MATACTQTITLLYIYLCVWGLDLRLNNINYFYWHYSSSIIIISLYWTSETPLSSSITTSECYGTLWTWIIFIFLFLLFSDFIGILFSFSFSFRRWRGTWQGSHMTGHMMWCHRPRPWWKDLEDDIRAHGVCMVALSKKWGEHEVEAWTIGQV